MCGYVLLKKFRTLRLFSLGVYSDVTRGCLGTSLRFFLLNLLHFGLFLLVREELKNNVLLSSVKNDVDALTFESS